MISIADKKNLAAYAAAKLKKLKKKEIIMKIIKTINMRGDFILQTRKNQMAFKSEKGEALEFACLQAQALARFFAGNGRFLVFETSANSALVQYDPSPVRDGVEEDFEFCAFQNANSGTVSWREARTFNLMD